MKINRIKTYSILPARKELKKRFGNIKIQICCCGIPAPPRNSEISIKKDTPVLKEIHDGTIKKNVLTPGIYEVGKITNSNTDLSHWIELTNNRSEEKISILFAIYGKLIFNWRQTK